MTAEDVSLQVEARQSSKLQVGEAEISSLASQLSAEEASNCDSAMIRRYIRACSGDHKQALRRIRDTLRWHNTERPNHMVCTACARDPKSHYMQVVGRDRGQRPTMYSCLAIPNCRNLDETRAHMISVFQQAIAAMPPGVEDWVWVLDMHGFGLRDVDPRIAHAFLTVSAAHYPERLAQAYIVSAPRLFQAFWHTIAPFIDSKTKSKIYFGHHHKRGPNDKLRAAFARNMDEETVQWLMDEMAENREKSVARRKHYSYPALAALARDPEHATVKEAAAARCAASVTGRHDLLGTPDFLASMAGRSDLLPPSVFMVAEASVRNGLADVLLPPTPSEDASVRNGAAAASDDDEGSTNSESNRSGSLAWTVVQQAPPQSLPF